MQRQLPHTGHIQLIDFLVGELLLRLVNGVKLRLDFFGVIFSDFFCVR